MQPDRLHKKQTAARAGAIAAAVILLSSLLAMSHSPATTAAFAAKPDRLKIGVLLYTHGDMMNEHSTPTMDKMMAIEEMIEKRFKSEAEIIFHMPYNWDEGLKALDEQGVDYAIFLYTDMFGPQSTVIHNVTRGVFGGIEQYNHCPGVPIGDACMYMGQVTTPASEFSDTPIVFAEPARPDHPVLKKIFLKQAKAASEDPGNELLVLVGHGARSDTNDMHQEAELSRAAAFVEKKMKFAGSMGVTAREDWPDLSPIAVDEAVSQIKDMLGETGAEKVLLVPATGGMGFDMVAEALEAEGIEYIAAPEDLPIGEKAFVKWAAKTVKETIDFIKKTKPGESTITPFWARQY